MAYRLGLYLIASLAAASCGRESLPLELSFVARLGADPIGCSHQVDGLALTDLRFYVHAAHLNRAGDGSAVPVEFDDSGRWQGDDLALIDLEDGTGSCDNGTPDTHAVIRATVPRGEYRGLQFTLGVPFAANHADPLAAGPPLDDSTMHWHWRSGYKFLRVGIETPDDGFWMHLGSAGCEGTVGSISGCRFPNRVLVSLPDYRPGDRVVVDLAALAAAVELGDGIPTDCSSGPAETSCRAPFAVVGLDFASGDRLSVQRLFQVQR